MSARLKLKKLKKRIEIIESYGHACEHEMARIRSIMEDNIQQIGVDYEIPPMSTIQGAMEITDMTINKLADSIIRAYTETLATFIKHKIYQLHFTRTFQRISVRFFAPKINDEHVKLWPVDKIDI